MMVVVVVVARSKITGVVLELAGGMKAMGENMATIQFSA
jgi:hypothetical protein